jgi:hypothetical protein
LQLVDVVDAGSSARHRRMSFRYQVIVSAYRNSVASGKRPLLAPNGHGAAVAACLLLGQQRTTFARREYFAF